MPYPARRRADIERSRGAVPPRRRGGVFTPVAPALTALGLLLPTLPGHGHGAEAAARPGTGGESALAAPSAVTDRFEILLAEIEAGVRDLRLRADAGLELERQLATAERRTAELTAALDEARAAETALRQACEAAEARVRELSKRLDASEEQGADLRAALGAAEARIAQLSTQRDDAARRAEELTNELEQALTEAAWVDRELEAAWQAAEARTAAVEEAQAARAAAEAELAKVRREADARATDLTDRLAASTAEAELLRSRLRAAEARLKRLHASLIAADRSAAQTAAPEPEPLEEGSAEPPVVEAPPPSPSVRTAALVAEPRTGALNAATVRPEPPRRSPPELAALDTRRTERGLAMIVPGDRLFRFDSDEIHPEAGDALARIGRVLEHYRDRNVLIVGHTDATGDPAYNQDLSERRARAVREYFVGAFDLNPRRIRTAGQGASNPIASNATPLGRRQNRRVEVLVLN